MEKSFTTSAADVKEQKQPVEETKNAPAESKHNFAAFNEGDFRLEWMKIKDAESGKILWQNEKWNTSINEI